VITLKTSQEVEAIGRAGAILARLFEALAPQVRPGVTTGQLDRFADRFIRGHDGARPAFKGLYGFPRSVCISVNDEVVHGIPSEKRVLQDGDLLSFDAGVHLDGWYADAAVTYPVGEVDEEAARLIEVTRLAMLDGIAAAVPGNRLGDIGQAVQRTAEAAGFSVVRDLVGHGIGRGPHEEPQIPNFGRAGHGLALESGMVVCIEPMVNAGRPEVRTLADRWTVVTADQRRSAHFEHTLAIQPAGPKILTVLPGVDPLEGRA
jgi:methionyl aminopeptidase